MALPDLVGKYSYESAENVDEYLKGLGVGLVLRKVQSVARPTIEITYDVDTSQWTVLTESVFKTKRITFKAHEKFEDDTYDSRKCQTFAEIHENRRQMTWNQSCEKGPDVITTITCNETGFTLTMKSGEFSCELIYRRQLGA